MPPAGWNGFPSGCQGNLWSTPPPLQLRRPPCGCTALELNSQRAHKRTGNRITRIVTRIEKFSDVCEFTDRAHATHTHVRRILDPALLRTAMLNSLFSECPAFPVFLHGFRRWWTDECGSRVSLLLIECQNFLKCIRTKNRVIFLSQRRNFEVSKNLSFQIPFERMKILSRSRFYRSWPRFTNRLWKRFRWEHAYRTRNLSLSFIGR